ncbi:MAG: L-aspartate oxidase [Planctomycetes bacterium]|nr:L-aspartate oxidase [Planctomycetota bacterium]
MANPPTIRKGAFRRYLVNFDPSSLPTDRCDVLVVGGGAAGLRSAIEAANLGANVIVLAKNEVSDCNTYLAQGGIATVMDDKDSVESHIRDTLSAGIGICDESAVSFVVTEARSRIEELISWGAPFDRTNSHLALTKEGGHSVSRILHIGGDSTGRGLHETLQRVAKSNPNIRIVERAFAIDLVSSASMRIVGVLVLDEEEKPRLILAGATILATGGAGAIYRETTNPASSTGDGVMMAFRAGAIVRDIEFVQFHPTTLYIAGASRLLVSEAVRGEGAYLVNAGGERFMHRYHDAAELAPRDVVSLAIVKELARTKATSVFLDLRHKDPDEMLARFPGIASAVSRFGLDLARDLIPVRPSAHYVIGGVKVNQSARTNLRGLLACGECSSTGLHGANRLGSNSLIEALVYGEVAGRNAVADSKHDDAREPPQGLPLGAQKVAGFDYEDMRRSLQTLLWRQVGITRNARDLGEAKKSLHFWSRYLLEGGFERRGELSLQNQLQFAILLANAADMRQESRGVHTRMDFEKRDDENWLGHFEISVTGGYVFHKLDDTNEGTR